MLCLPPTKNSLTFRKLEDIGSLSLRKWHVTSTDWMNNTDNYAKGQVYHLRTFSLVNWFSFCCKYFFFCPYFWFITSSWTHFHNSLFHYKILQQNVLVSYYSFKIHVKYNTRYTFLWWKLPFLKAQFSFNIIFWTKAWTIFSSVKWSTINMI